MGKKAGLSSANSQEQVKARVSRVKQAPAHDWLARVAMKFEVLEGLYPDSRKGGSNNFDLTPHFPPITIKIRLTFNYTNFLPTKIAIKFIKK